MPPVRGRAAGRGAAGRGRALGVAQHGGISLHHARLGRATGDAAGRAAIRAGAFVQAMMASAQAAVEAEAVALFRKLDRRAGPAGGGGGGPAPSREEGAALATLAADINAGPLDFVQLAVKRVAMPGEADGGGGGGGGGHRRSASRSPPTTPPPGAGGGAHPASAHYCLVNVEPDAVAAALGSELAPAEVAYLRALLHAMARDGSGVTGRLAAGAALAAQTVAMAVADGGGGGGGDENGSGAAAADPARPPPTARTSSPGTGSAEGTPSPAPARPGAAAAVPLPPRAARPAILRKLAAAGWLATGRGGGGGGGDGGSGGRRGAAAAGSWYAIGPRSFAELGAVLAEETDAPEDRKAAWAAL